MKQISCFKIPTYLKAHDLSPSNGSKRLIYQIVRFELLNNPLTLLCKLMFNIIQE